MDFRRGVRWVGLIILCLALAGGLFVGTWRGYVYLTEVPPNHRRVDFAWLAKQEPRLVNGTYEISEALRALDGQRIFVKGSMYPMAEMTGLTSFVLCENELTGSCYGPVMKISDMILVKMAGGLTVNHHERELVGVTGTLKVKPQLADGLLVGLFTLDATHFR